MRNAALAKAFALAVGLVSQWRHRVGAVGVLIVLVALLIDWSGGARAGESPTAFNLAEARQGTGEAPHKTGRPRHKTSVKEIIPVVVLGATDIIREAERWLGSGNFTGKPGAWCAWAVSAWLQATGHRPLASGMAASALTYGPHLAAPRIGALAVLSTRRGWAAHVGIVRRVEGDKIELISGNWGHRVAIGIVPRRQISAFMGV